MPERTPCHGVVIAGAGPVGLFLACELRLAGCSVLVLERSTDQDGPLKRAPFGLRGLSVPTVESLDRRGLLAAIEERAPGSDTPGAAHWTAQPRRPGGHFAGIPFFLDQVDVERWPHGPPGPVGSVAAEMATIEAVLTARAEASGVEILRGRAVEGLTQSDEGVTVRAGGASFHGGWLVGCDGARSAVRKAAGIGFAGTDPEFTGYAIQAELAHSAGLKPGRHHTAEGMVVFTPPGTVAMVDFDGGAAHRVAPITRDHVEAVLRKVSGTGVAVTRLDLATTWTDRAHQAAAYRRGRVLLAGDAAHIHSPLGGQGLNLGLGDAMNLGWKLAATVRGDAPAGLLDTYGSERHPVGAQVLDWSRAQVALMRPDRGARALAGVLRDLVETRDGATYVAGRVWGVSLRYDLGGGHAAVGRSVPDLAWDDGTRVGSLMRDGRGLLLDAAGDPALRDLADRWPGRLRHVVGEARTMPGLRAMLVRPDGIVAWASDGRPDLDAARAAAARWFGG